MESTALPYSTYLASPLTQILWVQRYIPFITTTTASPKGHTITQVSVPQAIHWRSTPDDERNSTHRLATVEEDATALTEWLREGHGLELEQRKRWKSEGGMLGDLDLKELKGLKTCAREERPTGVVDVLFCWEGVEEWADYLEEVKSGEIIAERLAEDVWYLRWAGLPKDFPLPLDLTTKAIPKVVV